MPLDGVVAAKIASQGPLFARANVVGVAIGTKRIHEHDTRERCISVFVERKRPIEHLRRRDVVPKEMSGVLTDVVETGRFSAMPLTQTVDEGRTHKMRPAEGGVSIGHYRITAGTLGVLARRGGRPVILSNNHVLANGNAGAIGDLVRKSVRTTGLTDGHVTAIDAVVEVDYRGGKTAMFRGQIVSDMLSKGGDSGSLVVDDRRRAVGLLFAGGPTTTLINPIGAVMQALEIVIG